MTYGSYIKLLLKIVLSSTFVLALFIGIPILLTGEEPATLSLNLGFDAVDGVFIIVGLPLLAAVLFAVVSPLSFFCFKIMNKKSAPRE